MLQSGELRRVLGPWSVTAFGVTNQIAAGLFFVSTQIQQTVPGTGSLVPLLMLVGGVLTFLTVLAYRYFFSLGIVGAGGEYLIIARSFGPRLGFFVTLLSWFGITGALGTLAYTAPSFLSAAAAAANLPGVAAFLATPQGTLFTGLFLIWAVWLLHVRGIKSAAVFAVISMVVVLAVTLVVIVYGFATTPAQFAAGLASHLHVSLSAAIAASTAHLVDPAAAFWSALPLLFFAYLGLSTATQTGSEAVSAPQTLSRGVLNAVLIVSAVYVLFTAAVYHAVPWQAMNGLAVLDHKTATTSTGLLGMVMPNWLASAMNVFVAFIVVKTFVPMMLAQSRWIYAWGADGMLPGHFAAVHRTLQTPVLALTLGAVLGSLSLWESLQWGYVFGVSLRVFSMMIVFFFVGAALARKIRWLGSLIILFSLWFAASIVLRSFGQPLTLQTVLAQPLFQGAVVLLAGLVIYRLSPRARAKAAAGTAGSDTSAR